MKLLTTLISIACVLTIAAYATDKQKGAKSAMDIKDVRLMMTPDVSPDADLPHHKYHDIVVYRTMAMGNSYVVYFYSNFGNELFCYKASWAAKDDLNKVSYTWVNDTLANIRLFSTGSKKEVKMQVYGKKGADGNKVSGMRME